MIDSIFYIFYCETLAKQLSILFKSVDTIQNMKTLLGKGLNQSTEDLIALGVDAKYVKETEAKELENYKKQSLEVGYDIRFPKPKKEIDWKPLTKETKLGKELITNKEKLK